MKGRRDVSPILLGVIAVVTPCVWPSTAAAEAPEAAAEGRAAADHQGAAAPGGGGSGRLPAAGPAEPGEHTQQDGAEHGLPGAEPGGEGGRGPQ